MQGDNPVVSGGHRLPPLEDDHYLRLDSTAADGVRRCRGAGCVRAKNVPTEKAWMAVDLNLSSKNIREKEVTIGIDPVLDLGRSITITSKSGTHLSEHYGWGSASQRRRQIAGGTGVLRY